MKHIQRYGTLKSLFTLVLTDRHHSIVELGASFFLRFSFKSITLWNSLRIHKMSNLESSLVDPIQLAMDPSLGPKNATSTPAPEKLRQSAVNEEELRGISDGSAAAGGTGLEKIEAAALVWSKQALWAIYFW